MHETEKVGQWRLIARELARHAPFTAFGAVTGLIVLLIIVFGNVSPGISETVFYILHPIHVLLSALVTTSIYRLHGKGKLWAAILIGYTGAIVIATLSDAIIPYLEGALFGTVFPIEREPFWPLPFIAEWQLVNPLAFLGIAIGYWKPATRIPHAGHVLLSTWASLFYFTAFMAADWIPLLPLIFLFLFIAVLIPCCVSDIVYPLLFVRKVHNHDHA